MVLPKIQSHDTAESDKLTLLKYIKIQISTKTPGKLGVHINTELEYTDQRRLELFKFPFFLSIQHLPNYLILAHSPDHNPMDEKEPDSSHESDPTAAAGSSSTLIPQSEMTMGIEELSVGDRSVVLRGNSSILRLSPSPHIALWSPDFVVECSLEDAAYLSDELTLTIFGISEEQDTGRMEKVSPTTWIYYRVIEL